MLKNKLTRKPSLAATSPKQPVRKRTCKRGPVKLAEAIEAMLWKHASNKLDDNGKTRANLIKQILFDMQNDAHVNVDHPEIVRAYVLAVCKDHPYLDHNDYHDVQQKFDDIRDLLAGYVTDPTLKNNFKKTACAETRVEQIDRVYNRDDELTVTRAADGIRAANLGRAEEDNPDKSLSRLRDKLSVLERLPENEGIRLQLESEIYKLENSIGDDEWPDVIGGGL